VPAGFGAPYIFRLVSVRTQSRSSRHRRRIVFTSYRIALYRIVPASPRLRATRFRARPLSSQLRACSTHTLFSLSLFPFLSPPFCALAIPFGIVTRLGTIAPELALQSRCPYTVFTFLIACHWHGPLDRDSQEE